MSSILYTSGNNFYLRTDDGASEFASEKIVNYCNTVKGIRRRNEWKTSGAGARFMNTYEPEYDEDATRRDAVINGASACGDGIIYTATVGEVSGIFKKTLEKGVAEGLVMSSRDMAVYKLSAHGGSCVASVGNRRERHIAIFNLETGSYRELTEGEVLEDYPSYSGDGGKIVYSSAGLALDHNDIPVGVGPYGIFYYHIANSEISEALASDRFDYILPREDKDGGLLFIKRPYKGMAKEGSLLKDILLFPIRIIRAIGGLLNFFSIMFGGESLRTGKSGKDVKTKQMSEKDLFFDGNVINAQEALKENQRHGEKNPGIIPRSWELIRMDRDGNESCIKKGVMDYVLCDNGDIVYSNGNAVLRITADGGEQLVEKCRMANNLVELR